MKYQYYNKFNLSDELSQTLESIISKKEKKDYICKNILVTIPKHEGLVFNSPLDEYEPYGGGINALTGVEIRKINEQYGRYIEGIIDEKTYSYFAIMTNENYKKFCELSFENEDQINTALKILSVIYEEYEGVFDSQILIKKFPYLKKFFKLLDEWREKTGRVLIDMDVLDNSAKVLYKKANSKKQ